MEIKEIILNSLTMKKVLEYYGFKTKGNQFCCPFHGDKTPSAKSYNNSYYCFACNSTGDLIQFVEDYFNLDFKQAMEKLNYDFSLGINFKMENKKELEKAKKIIEEQRKERIKKEKEYNNKMKELCQKIHNENEMINILRNNINPFEWEKNVKTITYLQEEIEWLEFEFEQNLK